VIFKKSNGSNTKCNYKIGQICEVIFYQDDENNCCIAIVMELFFEEVMIKKNEQIGLICSYIWYNLNKLHRPKNVRWLKV